MNHEFFYSDDCFNCFTFSKLEMLIILHLWKDNKNSELTFRPQMILQLTSGFPETILLESTIENIE